MGFAILRTKKIKTAGGVNLSLKHAYRDQITPNANPNLTPQNEMLVGKTREEALSRFNERLSQVQGKIRSNGVRCVEYLVTGSPEEIKSMSREKQDEYFRKALKWIEDRHGAENIISAGIHRDESTPHLYVHVVPMDRERHKLNCRAFLGGADMLSKMQTDFYESVAKSFGLARGIKGSKARHTRVRDFYKNINDHQQIAEFDRNRQMAWRQAKIDIEPRIIGYKDKFLGLKQEPVYENKLHIEERIYKENFQPVADRNYQYKLENERLKAQNKRFESGLYLNATGLRQEQRNAIQSEISALQAKNEIEREEQKRLEREKQAQKRSFGRGGMKI